MIKGNGTAAMDHRALIHQRGGGQIGGPRQGKTVGVTFLLVGVCDVRGVQRGVCGGGRRRWFFPPSLPSFAWGLWLAVCNFLVLARSNLPMAVARLMPHLPTWVGRQLANASVQHPWPAHFR
jgi:hypothetical protein